MAEPFDPLHLITAVATPPERSLAVGALAHALGVQEVLFFVEDSGNGVMLPAPGFRKTLPGRARWRAFLEATCQQGRTYGSLPIAADAEADATGVCITAKSAVVLLGGVPAPEVLEAVHPYFPLLVRVLEGEMAARQARAQEMTAREEAAQLKGIAEALDVTRLRYQQALQVAEAATQALEHELAERRQVEQSLRQQRHVLETVNKVDAVLAAELDLDKLVQAVTDAGTDLTGAQFGAFFYNVINPQGEAYLLYTISGAPREAFSRFPMPRNTAIFHPTFSGEGVVRSDDITQDPRYGQMAPHFGMPEGHLPVRSYLAVPVIARNGDVIGGLFFGHADPAVFTPAAEEIVQGIAAQAALAIENARLFSSIRAAEAELRALNETLETRVRARTEELSKEVEERTHAEQALARAVEQLEARNRELQEFAYVASHDLQEPLRKIRSFANLLVGDYGALLDDQGRAYLNRMEQAAARMSSLIRDLLDYSRVATQGHHFQRIALEPLVTAVLLDLEVLVSDTEGRVEVGPLPEIVADPTQMRQLFQNLIGNALKFHRSGVPPQVKITATPDSMPGARQAYRLEVADNGVGFEPKYADRIFMPFQRLHTRERFAGTGIGLAICRRIVERHDGVLTATSTPDQGSTFSILLPADPLPVA
jgi:signal transduction histidine kinase